MNIEGPKFAKVADDPMIVVVVWIEAIAVIAAEEVFTV